MITKVIAVNFLKMASCDSSCIYSLGIGFTKGTGFKVIEILTIQIQWKDRNQTVQKR